MPRRVKAKELFGGVGRKKDIRHCAVDGAVALHLACCFCVSEEI